MLVLSVPAEIMPSHGDKLACSMYLWLNCLFYSKKKGLFSHLKWYLEENGLCFIHIVMVSLKFIRRFLLRHCRAAFVYSVTFTGMGFSELFDI